MAISKLSLYNDALLLIGQRELSSDTEDRPPRHYLDHAYDDPSAVDVCLSKIRPRFATKTVKLSSPAVSSEHGLDSVHTLPAEYVSMVEVYSDEKLDQPVSRYLIEDRTVICEHDVIYVRFISNDRAMTSWSPIFAQCVTIYLARQISIKLAPELFESLHTLFGDSVKLAGESEGLEEPRPRSSAPLTTLNSDWLRIYNDALLVMGLPEITSGTDDSNRRVKLDHALSANLVEALLESIGWQFALQSQKITYNPSATPEWGYTYAFDKPDDLHRLDGIWSDESMRNRLKYYDDEQGKWFADLQIIYVKYVSTTFLTQPSNWPAFFKRLVAAKLAMDASASLKKEGADVQRSTEVFIDREHEAKGIDALQSPPRVIASGSWINSRTRGFYRNNRPGEY